MLSFHIVYMYSPVLFFLWCFLQISFTVFDEALKGCKAGNHWYVLSLNFEAGRFEALDSMRGEGSQSLRDHATALMDNIKAVWDIYYSDSKVQIRDYKLQIINVPIQGTTYVKFISSLSVKCS